MVGGPLVSCIVPAYNSAEHVGAAVESILAQTHRPLEVLVCDDGSEDATVEIASAFGAPVRVLEQETAGPAATRNLGIGAAQADFLAFLDADDLWAPQKLERQLAQFSERAELDCSLTHVRMFWSGDAEDEAERYAGHARAGDVPGYATTTLLARRSAFDRVGLLDPSLWFSDATDWFLRATDAGLRIEVLPEVLTYHRMHATNITRRREGASRREFLAIVRRSLERRRAG